MEETGDHDRGTMIVQISKKGTIIPASSFRPPSLPFASSYPSLIAFAFFLSGCVIFIPSFPPHCLFSSLPPPPLSLTFIHFCGGWKVDKHADSDKVDQPSLPPSLPPTTSPTRCDRRRVKRVCLLAGNKVCDRHT